ncbi:GntR family transcriptional regulator [Allohahella marinimesophila]|uniref:GntR family transcriptional regulator n=1 Tax=Allohahella marinimesophila TaxID=1054972 RepID=A0ABP7PFD1_9GAMM
MGKISPMPLPLFQQIKAELRARILDGSYSVHERLPSEAALTESFGVSRITVRQALSELQKDGLVFKINGKGTFVSKPRASLDVSRLRGFGEAMSSLGYETFSRVLDIRDMADKADIQQQLSLPGKSLVKRIRRLRYLNRAPVSVDVSWFAPGVGDRVAQADLEGRDILSILENDCHLHLGKARLNIEALLCDDELAHLLKTEEGSPALHIERIICDTDGAPVLYENLYYRGDAFRYSLNIERQSDEHDKHESTWSENHDARS